MPDVALGMRLRVGTKREVRQRGLPGLAGSPGPLPRFVDPGGQLGELVGAGRAHDPAVAESRGSLDRGERVATDDQLGAARG